MSTLEINSRTTGFASPAESYVDKRLDLNDLIIKDIYSTFYFRYKGEDMFGVKDGDVLVVDKSEILKKGDIVIVVNQKSFKLEEYFGQTNVWGKITWVLNKK